jgi:disulfide bond formation protein DsbB
LCLQERIPYYLAIPLGFAAAMLAATSLRAAALLLAVVSAAFLYNAGLSIYHAGAEWHFWAGPATCSPVEQVGTTDLLAALKHNRPVRCDEAALRIFGISLAGYNALISAALAALGLLALLRSRFWHRPL